MKKYIVLLMTLCPIITSNIVFGGEEEPLIIEDGGDDDFDPLKLVRVAAPTDAELAAAQQPKLAETINKAKNSNQLVEIIMNALQTSGLNISTKTFLNYSKKGITPDAAALNEILDQIARNPQEDRLNQELAKTLQTLFKAQMEKIDSYTAAVIWGTDEPATPPAAAPSTSDATNIDLNPNGPAAPPATGTPGVSAQIQAQQEQDIENLEKQTRGLAQTQSFARLKAAENNPSLFNSILKQIYQLLQTIPQLKAWATAKLESMQTQTTSAPAAAQPEE